MTTDRAYTLMDVVDEGLAATNSAPTGDVIRWILMNRRHVLDENCMTCYSGYLGQLIRARRKKRDTPPTSIQELCFDFGMELLDLPDEISVPTDIQNPISCPCEWPQIDDATVDDLDKHLVLLDAQIELDMASRANIKKLRQVAAQVVPGRTDIPLRDLRRIARNGDATHS
jgi:hypothetical protein